MGAITKTVWVEGKLLLRERDTIGATLLMPVLMLLIFGTIFVDSPEQTIGDRQSIGLMTTGFLGMLAATSGLMTMPTTIAAYRERGILRRLGVTPIRPITVIAAQISVQMGLTIISSSPLLVVAFVFYGLELPSIPLLVIPGAILGVLSMYAVGFIIAAVTRTLRAAQAIGTAVFFPMLFLSGATIPRSEMPSNIRAAGDFLPLTHMITLTQDLWFDGTWNLVSLAVLTVMLVSGIAIGTRLFRWTQ